MPDHSGKFAPTYKGPYVVKKALSKGALILADMNGHDFICPLILMLSYSSLHEGSFKCNRFFYIQQPKKQTKTKEKAKNKIQKYEKLD